MPLDPRTVPLFKKHAVLRDLDEDRFRDVVIRPVLLRKGLRHGADLCGPDEAGKDCYFTHADPFGAEIIYVVQTKAGNLNLGKKPAQNLLEAVTQLKTAFATDVVDINTKKKQRPNFAYLCINGVLNEQARRFIVEHVENPNIRFLDLDDVVNEIDAVYPEFWSGIIGDAHPYLRRIVDAFTEHNEFLTTTESGVTVASASPVSDAGFAHLKLTRTFLKTKKSHGRFSHEPDFEDVSVEDLVTYDFQYVVILGEAGCGKSTAMKRLAEQTARRILEHDAELPVPVFLRATDVATDSATLAEIAIQSTRALTLSGESAFGVDDLTKGTVRVLIDALDEIGSKDHFEGFSDKLAVFRQNFPLCPIVIAGRNYSYIQSMAALADFRRFSIAPIGHKEATKIIQNVGRHRSLERGRTREILRQLEHIHGIDLSPLLVTIFVSSSEANRRDIPANITELFAKYTEELLGRWDRGKGIAQQYEANLKVLLLQRVAFGMHTRKEVSVPFRDFQRYVEHELADVGLKEAKIDALLDEIRRSGLFREFDDRIEFRHLLIQEYFAGRGISDPSRLADLAEDEWWRRAVVFYFGANPSNESSLRKVIDECTPLGAAEQFNVALTVGLAAQACYFIKLKQKTAIMAWVIESLASSSDAYLPSSSTQGSYPLSRFLIYYIMGRDGVAAECLENRDDFQNVVSEQVGAEVRPLVAFWYIAGLIEAGRLDLAFEILEKVDLQEDRYYLALHLGSFLARHVRSTDRATKSWAGRILKLVEPKIVGLRKDFFKEFKSQLLELHKGQVRELPENEFIEPDDTGISKSS